MPQHQITLTSLTGRLKLVPPNAADDMAVSVLRSHPITRRYLRFLPEHFSVDEARIRREKIAADDRIIDFHAHLQNNDGTTTFIGMLGLLDIDVLNDSCAVGILVSPDHHRAGIATEVLYTLLNFVFEDRKLHRVKFETGADNDMMQVQKYLIYIHRELIKAELVRECGRCATRV